VFQLIRGTAYNTATVTRNIDAAARSTCAGPWKACQKKWGRRRVAVECVMSYDPGDRTFAEGESKRM